MRHLFLKGSGCFEEMMSSLKIHVHVIYKLMSMSLCVSNHILRFKLLFKTEV